MTRRQEIIAELLGWYEAVLNSWENGMASGTFGFPLMNAIWNHPSYVELERLLVEMRSLEPVIYWNITQRYLYAPSKMVMRCASCGPKPDTPEAALLHAKDEHVLPYGDKESPPLPLHRHGRKVVTLRPQRVRVPSLAIDLALVLAGIEWLDKHWVGEPFIPDWEMRVA